MDWTMVLAFSGLSIFAGILVGLGTMSIIRGLFVSFMFIGLALTAFLMELGLNEIPAFFLGQVIVMGSTYIYLKILQPEILKKIQQEFSGDQAPSCH